MAKEVSGSSVQEVADFEKALILTGFGKFHYQILCICAISIISVGFQNGLSSYVFPAAQCELGLSSFELGLLNVSFLVGGVSSGFLWGILADINGRKKILVVTHLLNFAVTISCALLSHPMALIICRFFNGFFIGAPGSIIFSYTAEFQSTKYRSTIICCCGIFFTSSWLLLPLLAYLILPLEMINIDISNYFLVILPWRMFLIILVVPELIAGIALLKMPESPKFYTAQGDPRKCLMVLRRMYSTNTGRHPDEYPVKNLLAELKIQTRCSEKIQENNSSKVIHSIKIMTAQMGTLFRQPLLKVTAVTCVVMFANMFGVFGLGIWLPELFLRFKEYQKLHPNSTSVSVKELSTLNQLSTSNNTSCEPTFDATVIQNTILLALSSMLYNGLCGYFSSKVSIKVIPLVSMVIGGLAAGAIYWLTTSLQNLVVACAFQAAMLTANMTIGNVGVELFPTKVGGIALCLIMGFGRFGAICSNILFGYFIDTQCEGPIFVVAAVVLLGAVLCFWIPNPKNEEAKCSMNGKNKVNDIKVSVIS